MTVEATTKDAGEIEILVEALDKICTLITRSGYGPKPASRPIKAMTIDEMMLPENDFPGYLRDDPVGTSLRLAIKKVGKRLDQIGGDRVMRDVCERVANMDEAKFGWRTNLMDKHWDGIGDWIA